MSCGVMRTSARAPARRLKLLPRHSRHLQVIEKRRQAPPLSASCVFCQNIGGRVSACASASRVLRSLSIAARVGGAQAWARTAGQADIRRWHIMA